MKHVNCTLQILIFFFVISLQAQTNTCTNIDFENQNFSSWNGSYGYSSGLNWSNSVSWTNAIKFKFFNAPVGEDSAYHTLLTQIPLNNNPAMGHVKGYDTIAIHPISGLAEIPFISPLGGNASVRLGNAPGLKEISRLSYSIPVTSQNNRLTIHYATVLNDVSAHAPGEHPFFTYRIKVGGNVVQNACLSDTIMVRFNASDSIFTNIPGDIFYSKWRAATLDLSAYNGLTVDLELIAADCAIGGHFGYAYVDAVCGSSSVLPYSFCANDVTHSVASPEGFTSWQWAGPNNQFSFIPSGSGGTNDTLFLNSVTGGQTYFLYATDVNGCTSTWQSILQNNTLTVYGFDITPPCKGGANGSVSALYYGTTAPVTYSWEDTSGNVLSTSTSLSSVAEGCYKLTLSSAGCGSFDTTFYLQHYIPCIDHVTVALCENAGALHYPGYSNYQWYFPGGNAIANSNTDSLFITNVMSGSNYYLSFQNGSCIDTAFFTVNLTPAPASVSVINVDEPCGPNGSTGELSVLISNPVGSTYDYFISGPNGFSSAASTLDSLNTVTNLSPGNYEVLVLDSGCYHSLSYTVNYLSAPYSPSVSDPFICAGDTSAIQLNFGSGNAGSGLACGSDTSSCSANLFVQVGNGTVQNLTTGWPTVFGNWYANEKYQILYRASDLVADGMSAGTIKSISFYVDSIVAGMNTTFINYTVKFACTSVSDLDSGNLGSTVPFVNVPMVTVFGPQNYTISTGWNTLNFTNGYHWNGVDNLLIDICYDWSAPSAFSVNAVMKSTQTAYRSFLNYNSDVTIACPQTTANMSYNLRPNTRFGMCGINYADFYDVNWSPTIGLDTTAGANVNANPSSTTTYTFVVTPLAGGCSFTDSVTVNVNQTPVTTISLPSADLVCTPASTYQWYFNGTIISGANSQTYTPSQNGDYYCVVTYGSCGADTSNTYQFYSLSANEIAESGVIKVYPNPFREQFTVRVVQGEFEKMTLVDFSGKEIEQINCSGRTSVEINTSDFTPGIYFLYSVSAAGKTTCVKLVKSDY